MSSQSTSNQSPNGAYAGGSRIVAPGPEVRLERLDFVIQGMADRITELEKQIAKQRRPRFDVNQAWRWLALLFATGAAAAVVADMFGVI